jgi:hypothetical protein
MLEPNPTFQKFALSVIRDLYPPNLSNEIFVAFISSGR